MFWTKKNLPEIKLLKIYFNPMQDITPYQLAYIMKHAWGPAGLTGEISIPQDTWDALDPYIKRHFTSEP